MVHNTQLSAIKKKTKSRICSKYRKSMQTLQTKWKIVHVVQSLIPSLQPAKLEADAATNSTRIDWKISTMSMVEISSTKRLQKGWAACPALIQRLTNGQLWTSFKLWECTKRPSKGSRLNNKERQSCVRNSKNSKRNSLQGKRSSNRIDSIMREHAKRELAEKKLLKKPGQKRKRRKLRKLKSGASNIQFSANKKKTMSAKSIWSKARNWSKKMWDNLKMHSLNQLFRRRKLKTTGFHSMKKPMASRNLQSLKKNTRRW